MTSLALAPPCVVVTRPEPEATRWVHDLQRFGQSAHALPLIRIEPQLLCVERMSQLGEPVAWMFVSGAAVRGFFSQWPVEAVLRTSARYWCTGPGTTAALRAAGIPPERIDSPAWDAQQFDSEALWALVRTQVAPGAHVCVVRGGDAQGEATGRPWLARTLESAGAQVRTVVAYRRLGPVLDAAWADDVRRLVSPGHLWLFSSSEAVKHLRDALVSRPALPWNTTRALVTHPRIAQAVQALGIANLQIVAPVLEAVLAAARNSPEA